MRRTRTSAAGILLLALVLLAGACGDDDDDDAGAGDTTSSTSAKPAITIGSANFSENEMLAYMYGLVLADAGYEVSYKLKIGAREILQPALENGEIDMLPEYAGNYLSYLDKTAPSLAVEETVTRLRSLLEPKSISVLEPSDATDADAIAVTKDFATKNNLKTISDLKKVTTPLTLGGPPECETRITCKAGLEQVYGLKIGFKALDADGPLTRAALDNGDVQLARVFTADADLKTKGYVVLEDDMHFQQAGNITPVIRTEKLDDEAEELINKVSAALTTDELIDLNKSVQIDKEDAKAAAEAFLKSENLL